MATQAEFDAFNLMRPETMLGEDEIKALIDDANTLIDSLNLGLSDEILTAIKKYTAGHLSAVVDPLATTTKIDTAQESFEGSATGDNFQSSKFGRMAIAFDTTGTLVNLGKPQARFRAIGRQGTPIRRNYF